VLGDVTRSADPLVAVTLTYLFTEAAAQEPDRDAGRSAVESPCSLSWNHRRNLLWTRKGRK